MKESAIRAIPQRGQRVKVWCALLIAPAVLLAMTPVQRVDSTAIANRQWIGITVASERLALGCAQAGVIASVLVAEGKEVRRGEVLFSLTTDIETLEVERLRAIAESDAAVREATVACTMATREETRYLDLHRRQITGDAELDERRLAAEIARIRLERAQLERKLDRIRCEQAQARLQQRIVRSPVDGTVVHRLHSRGEAVEELEPVIELVVRDPLWVEFDCPIEDAPLLPVGGIVFVDPGGVAEEPLRAEVLHAAPVVDAASQTFRVRLVLRAVPRSLKAGVRVVVRHEGD